MSRKALSRIELPGIPRGRIFAGPRQVELDDIAERVGRIADSFEAFKGKNDGRVEKIEATVGDIDKELRGIAIKVEASRTSGVLFDAGIMSHSDKRQFSDFCRGKINAALSTQSNPDGGWLVPESVDRNIAEIARSLSPMRQYATVVQGGLNYSKLVLTTGSATGWVSETQARPTLSGPGLSKISPPYGELYTMPAVTQTLLDTSDFDVASMLSTDIARQFAIQEGSAFISGSGINQPRGIATYDFVADASWAWGKVGVVGAGGSAFATPTSTVSPADCLINLVYALNPQYRVNAVWGMNKNTIGVVRQMKDAQGRFIWIDSVAPGQPATLLGYPVVEFPDMDDIGANKYPIMFGDLGVAYVINDVSPVALLRDPYSTKPYVLFYTTKRVAGAIVDFQAIKFLKMA